MATPEILQLEGQLVQPQNVMTIKFQLVASCGGGRGGAAGAAGGARARGEPPQLKRASSAQWTENLEHVTSIFVIC